MQDQQLLHVLRVAAVRDYGGLHRRELVAHVLSYSTLLTCTTLPFLGQAKTERAYGGTMVEVVLILIADTIYSALKELHYGYGNAKALLLNIRYLFV
mmetsp:Transcript_474/g.1539  ORF Transcript_474/g.1539 Transcript_474/m.1539 type:complete len:97 (-) Transcript_474:93-383(-)